MGELPPGAPENLNLYIECGVAAFITLSFLIGAFVNLRERHRDVAAWHVWVGALIYGVVFGAVIGFVILPLRLLLAEGSLPPEQAGYAGLGFLAVVIALRRGLLTRLPVLGPQVKAYRRAALRRSIEGAEKQIVKLSPKDA